MTIEQLERLVKAQQEQIQKLMRAISILERKIMSVNHTAHKANEASRQHGERINKLERKL